MKLIISIMVTIALFPILNISCRTFNINDITCMISFIIYLMQSTLITYITFFSGALLKINHKKIVQLIIVSIVGGLFGFISSLIIQDISISVWIVSSIILSIIIRETFYIDNIKFSNTYVFMIVSFIFAICSFIGWQTNIGYNKLINSVLYIVFCIIFAITTNRNHLESVIHRRSQNADSVPKHIYKYNMRLTLILCALPIPFVIFSNKIGSAIYNILISIFKGVIYVGSLISKLLSKDTQSIEEVENSTPAITPQYTKASTLIADITVILSMALIVFLIYYYHEEIIKKFKEIASSIRKNILKHLSYKENRQSVPLPSNDGYVDYIKDISKINSVYNKKSFKKDYKKYLKMENSLETFYFGYSLIISSLNLLGYDIKSFNTVTQISHKIDSIIPHNNISSIYLSIRYNNSQPTSLDKALLDDILRNICKIL